MRLKALLCLSAAALLAGCSGSEPAKSSGPHPPCCNAAYMDAQRKTAENGLDVPIQPRPRDAYRDLRQETDSRCGWDDQADLSPDGKWLAFASTDISPTGTIFMKPSGGPALFQKTTHPSENQWPRFSPDGKKIAFASNRNGNWDIFIMDTEQNGAVRQVTTGPADHIAPTWAPDGRRLAFSTKNCDGDWDIWIADLEVSQLTRLGPGLFPRWSPKEDKLVFQRARRHCGSWYGVYSVDVSGSNLMEIVAQAGWGAVDPCWDPTGDWIVFASVYKSAVSRGDGRMNQGDNLWIVRADGRGPWQVTVDAAPQWNPCWGRNGRIYFTAMRNGRTNLWSISPMLPDGSQVPTPAAPPPPGMHVPPGMETPPK